MAFLLERRVLGPTFKEVLEGGLLVTKALLKRNTRDFVKARSGPFLIAVRRALAWV